MWAVLKCLRQAFEVYLKPVRGDVLTVRSTGLRCGSGVGRLGAARRRWRSEDRFGIARAVGMEGEEVADGREFNEAEGMALQQRSGTAPVLDGEFPGRGPERRLVGQSEGMKAGETR